MHTLETMLQDPVPEVWSAASWALGNATYIFSGNRQAKEIGIKALLNAYRNNIIPTPLTLLYMIAALLDIAQSTYDLALLSIIETMGKHLPRDLARFDTWDGLVSPEKHIEMTRSEIRRTKKAIRDGIARGESVS